MRRANRVVRAGLWGVGVAGAVIMGGGLSLLAISRKVEVFVNTTISRQVDLAGRTLLAVPPEKRQTFLEWLVRLEAAVYVAVLEKDSLILYATAFPGFLPLRRDARPGSLYTRDLPIGEVKEVYHPLPGGRTLLYAFPYFEVKAWIRPWFWQSVLMLLAMALLAGSGTTTLLLWREAQREHQARQHRMQEKLQLLREVAHEIKSPLITVSLGLQHLLREDLPPHRKEDVRNLREQVEHLVRRIHEVVEQSSLLKERKRLDVPALLDKVSAALAPMQEEKALRLEVRVDVPRIHADPRGMEEALLNLLRNAMEASPPGGKVRVRVVPRGRGVAFVVEDEGPGIPQEFLEQIFQPGWTTKPGGSGLGLSIVRRVAREHGGRITFERRKEGGTRAWFWIPQEDTHET